METQGLFAFVTGTPFPYQCTPLPDKGGGVLSITNREYIKSLYERYCLETANNEYVYVCQVKQITRGTGRYDGSTDEKGRRLPVAGSIVDSVTPETYAAGRLTLRELRAIPETPIVNDKTTTGENRPDWQYYATATTDEHTIQVIVHRDRDDVPDAP